MEAKRRDISASTPKPTPNPIHKAIDGLDEGRGKLRGEGGEGEEAMSILVATLETEEI